ncbi:MAG: response regulator [Bacteroidales bacterium]|nr:response regulator [Bacteroidales bacterium]
MTDFSKYSLLMVDDVPLNLLVVTKMLSRFNFRIRTAANGIEALQKVAEEKPDLILLDILMPQMDGFEVLRRLRSDPATADLRVVILSALNTTEDIVKGFNLGANDFITKPIIMEKLISSVSDQLRLSGKGTSDPSL